MGTPGHQGGATGGGKDVFQPWKTNDRSLEMRKCGLGLEDPLFLHMEVLVTSE